MVDVVSVCHHSQCLDRKGNLSQVLDDFSAHLEGTLQGPEGVRLLVDDGVLVASNERFPEVVVRKWLLMANQRNSSFLYVV